MSGKILSLLVALCLAQGLVTSKSIVPFETIEDIISSLNEYVVQINEILDMLKEIILNKGEDYIKKESSYIDYAIDHFISTLRGFGTCGDDQIPKIENSRESYQEELKACILKEIPTAQKANESVTVIGKNITKMITDIESNKTECEKLTNIVEIGVCLGKLVNEVEPKIIIQIEEATPIVQDAHTEILTVQSCLDITVKNLDTLVQEILTDVESCQTVGN